MDELPTYRTRLERAKELAVELDGQAQAFYASRPYSVEKSIEAETGDTVYLARVHHPMPAKLGLTVGEIANHLRTGLDLMVAAIVRKANPGAELSKRLAFVVRDSREEFERDLEGCTRGLPAASRALMAAFKPYKGGDDVIWSIVKLDNHHKHHDNILTFSECQTVDVGGQMHAMMEQLIAKDGPEALARFRELPRLSVPLMAAEPPPMRDGEVLFRVKKGCENAEAYGRANLRRRNSLRERHRR